MVSNSQGRSACSVPIDSSESRILLLEPNTEETSSGVPLAVSCSRLSHVVDVSNCFPQLGTRPFVTYTVGGWRRDGGSPAGVEGRGYRHGDNRLRPSFFVLRGLRCSSSFNDCSLPTHQNFPRFSRTPPLLLHRPDVVLAWIERNLRSSSVSVLWSSFVESHPERRSLQRRSRHYCFSTVPWLLQ